MVSSQELVAYLDFKTKDKKYDRTVVTALFNQMDADRNGLISLEEFCDTYIKTEDILKKRHTEVCSRIAEHQT